MAGAERGDWVGLLSDARVEAVNSSDIVDLSMCLRASPAGVSGTFLGLGADGKRWWIKPPGQRDLEQALVTEFVVGKVGRLIGAPTCENTVVRIPADLVGFEYKSGKYLVEGFGHGTVHVEDAIEKRPHLEDRARDENRVRHVGIFALYDWCWGNDDQWLHSATADMATFSHDHGWYLPPPGPGWDQYHLELNVNDPHSLGQDATGLSPSAINNVADELEHVTREDLVFILRQVPPDWPVTDDDLECLGWFLEKRAPQVALRIRKLTPGYGD